ALAGFIGMSRGADRSESDKRACRSQFYDSGERDHGDISFAISVLKTILSLGRFWFVAEIGAVIIVTSAFTSQLDDIALEQSCLPSDFSKRNSVQDEVFEVSKALREQIRDRNAQDWRIHLASLTYERPGQEVHVEFKGASAAESQGASGAEKGC